MNTTTQHTPTSTQLRAAAALDSTHAIGECGPRTMTARKTLAAYLDGAIRLSAKTVRVYCAFLESKAAA